MNEERKISLSEYGIYIVSIDTLNSFLKKNKVRSKKVLSVFQENHDLYLKSLEEGVWIPIVPIPSVEYIINGDFGLSRDFPSDEWIEVIKYKNFNLEIMGESYWVGSFGDLLKFNPKEYLDAATSTLTYKYIDLFRAVKFEMDNGKYLVDITGYKRKISRNYPEANFGYSLSFPKTDGFIGYNDPRKDEIYTFDMSEL